MFATFWPTRSSFVVSRRRACDEVQHSSRLYDRLAPRYDQLHRRWLRCAGGEAQAALEGAARAIVRRDMALLDAGCGTGQFVRRLVTEGIEPLSITLLDASKAMLARSKDLAVSHIQAHLERLPFSDARFDVVTCAWALETTEDIDLATDEVCRVVRPNGYILLCFCADVQASGFTGWAMRKAVEIRGSGQFLSLSLVSRAFSKHSAFEVRRLPCGGPAVALLAQRLQI